MGHYAYVGSFTSENKERNRCAAGEGIHCFRVDPQTQDWEAFQTVREYNPAFIQLSRSRNLLYVGNSASEVPVGGIVTYGIDRNSGKLAKTERQLDLGKPICCFCERPQGDYLVAADFKGGLYVLRLNADGTLNGVTDTLQLEGKLSPLSNITCSRPHHCMFDAAGEHIVIADKGLDLVLVFAFDAASGKLRETCRAAVRPASCARHIAFHPNQKYVYIVAEYLCKIYVFDYDAQNGTIRMKQVISAERDTCVGECKSSEIQVHPNGKFLYVSNRGDDTIGVFEIDGKTGMLTSLEWTETTGEKPRYFGLTPEGTQLFVGNQKSGTIAVFHVDAQSGRLTLEKAGIPVDCPTWICLLDTERNL